MYRGFSAGTIAFGVLACGLIACSGSADQSGATAAAAAAADSTARVVSAHTIAAGTAIEATIQEAVSSSTSRVGQQVTAIVSRNVLDAGGNIAIPGGASIKLAIAQLAPAKGPSATDGSVALTMTSVSVHDTTYTPAANVGTVAHTLSPIAGKSGDRDVVVSPGTPITITLTQPLSILAK